MVELPSWTPTVDAIYKHYERRSKLEPRRGYLGASQIGNDCDRALWYGFHWAARPGFPGRILRLFDTGHREEERILNDLRAIGVRIEGTQAEFSACNGHFRGHLDAVGLGLLEAPKTWHLIEVKTMNKTSFNRFVEHGVEKSHPKYFDQMQVYMGAEELSRGALVAQCKDDDKIHIERVEYSGQAYRRLIGKAERIIDAASLPGRISEKPEFYKCRLCEYSMLCHTKMVPDVNCRTCAFSFPAKDSEWHCGALNGKCRDDCEEHLFNPSMLWWDNAIDHGDGWIEYGSFVNCTPTGFPAKDKPTFHSSDLQAHDF